MKNGGHEKKYMMTSKGFERFVFFSDAVVAIALTLLIIPLTDLAVEMNSHGESGSILMLLRDNFQTVLAFGISFFVIISMWNSHRKTFEKAKTADGYIVRYNSLWLLTIICTPFASQAISGNYRKENIIFYAVLLLLCTLCLRMISAHIAKNAESMAHESAEFDSVTSGWITPVTVIVIIVIIAIVPRNEQWAFFLLLIDTPLVEWVKKMVKGKAK